MDFKKTKKTEKAKGSSGEVDEAIDTILSHVIGGDVGLTDGINEYLAKQPDKLVSGSENGKKEEVDFEDTYMPHWWRLLKKMGWITWFWGSWKKAELQSMFAKSYYHAFLKGEEFGLEFARSGLAGEIKKRKPVVLKKEKA